MTLHAFLKPFDGFTAEDFETYSPEKWSSNIHNLARMRVKQKLEALGSQLAPTLLSEGLALDYETSSERPSIWNQKQVRAQWLYFFRDGRAQRELLALLDRERSIAENIDDPAHHHRHIVLGVRVDQQGVGLRCGIHRSAWLDRRNLQTKWADPHERAKLEALLDNLRDSIVWIAGAAECPLAEARSDGLDGVLSEAAACEEWLALEERFGPKDEMALTPAFGDTAARVLGDLLPFYRFVAWSQANDHASMAQKVVQEKKARRQGRNLPFDENDEVEIVGGLFAGQRGLVQGFDSAGKVKVKVGNLTLPVRAGSLKRLG